jgi:hypothetical protein
MRNGNAVIASAFVLAVSIGSISGCNLRSESPDPASRPASKASQGRPPTMRYQVDAERSRLWVLTRDGVVVHDVAAAEKVAVVLPGWVTVDAAYGCPPDIALGPRGEALVTSNIVPTLWRIDPETLAVSVHPLALDADTDKDVGFSGLAYSPQHGGFLAASYHHGSLWRVDAALERARKVALSAPIPQACGLAVRQHDAPQTLRPAANVCVLTPRGGWSITFAAGWRSAYVSAAPCAEAP